MKSTIHSIRGRQNEKFGRKIWSCPKSDQKLTKNNFEIFIAFYDEFLITILPINGTHKDPSVGKLIIKNPFVYDFVYIFMTYKIQLMP